MGKRGEERGKGKGRRTKGEGGILGPGHIPNAVPFRSHTHTNFPHTYTFPRKAPPTHAPTPPQNHTTARGADRVEALRESTTSTRPHLLSSHQPQWRAAPVRASPSCAPAAAASSREFVVGAERERRPNNLLPSRERLANAESMLDSWSITSPFKALGCARTVGPMRLERRDGPALAHPGSFPRAERSRGEGLSQTGGVSAPLRPWAPPLPLPPAPPRPTLREQPPVLAALCVCIGFGRRLVSPSPPFFDVVVVAR